MTRLGEKVQIQILKSYRTDYAKKYHLRELARELDMDHTSVRPHLNSLKQKGVIKEKEKGRNKVFSLNHTSDLLPYYLIQAEADRTSEYLESNNTIRAFWKNFRDKSNSVTLSELDILVLFGSFASGTQDKKSDIDLFLAAPEETISKVINIRNELETITGREIELEHTNDLRNLIVHEEPGTFGEIINNHIVLLGIEKFVQIARRFQSV